ncbi:hypothetical protein FRC02_007013, partial [Tulasnella sp. 418]
GSVGNTHWHDEDAILIDCNHYKKTILLKDSASDQKSAATNGQTRQTASEARQAQTDNALHKAEHSGIDERE